MENRIYRLFCSFIIVLAVCFSGASGFAGTTLSIHFLDVGLGDSTLVMLPSGENILIDTGGPAAAPELVNDLKKIGIKKIDHLIHTHPHDDHIGGIFNLLAEFSVGHFYDNGFSNFQSNLFIDYVKAVRSNLSQYSILQAGERIVLGEVSIEVVNPLLPPTGSLNNDSIMLRISYGDVKILLAGDVGYAGERRLLSAGTELKSQILKAAHHGENDACSPEFLKRVSPEVGIITVSTVNKYARPHPELLQRLQDAGVKVYKTNVYGTITVTTEGRAYTVETEKNTIPGEG